MALLHERRRTVTCYAAEPDCRLMDIQLEFSPPPGREAVELGQTTFGFLAVRAAPTMSPFDGGGRIVNSCGDRNEQGPAHLKHADWIDQSGPVGAAAGTTAGTAGKAPVPPAGMVWGGIAIFDDPQNPHHPSLWHCRNDGWACTPLTGKVPRDWRRAPRYG